MKEGIATGLIDIKMIISEYCESHYAHIFENLD